MRIIDRSLSLTEKSQVCSTRSISQHRDRPCVSGRRIHARTAHVTRDNDRPNKTTSSRPEEALSRHTPARRRRDTSCTCVNAHTRHDEASITHSRETQHHANLDAMRRYIFDSFDATRGCSRGGISAFRRWHWSALATRGNPGVCQKVAPHAPRPVLLRCVETRSFLRSNLPLLFAETKSGHSAANNSCFLRRTACGGSREFVKERCVRTRGAEVHEVLT